MWFRYVAFVVMALPSVAQSTDDVGRVLQLPFGAPLDRDIRECPSSGKVKRVMDYCSLGRAYKRGTSIKAMNMMLMPPPSDSEHAVPAWVAVDVVHLSLGPGGLVNRIQVQTGGPSRQDEVIESISARFGKPTTLDLVVKQNAFGATTAIKQASWHMRNIVIYHDCLELNRCDVAFSIPRREASVKVRQPVMP